MWCTFLFQCVLYIFSFSFCFSASSWLFVLLKAEVIGLKYYKWKCFLLRCTDSWWKFDFYREQWSCCELTEDIPLTTFPVRRSISLYPTFTFCHFENRSLEESMHRQYIMWILVCIALYTSYIHTNTTCVSKAENVCLPSIQMSQWLIYENTFPSYCSNSVNTITNIIHLNQIYMKI